MTMINLKSSRNIIIQFIFIFLLFISFISQVYSEENNATSNNNKEKTKEENQNIENNKKPNETIKLPINLYDSLTFSSKNSVYVRSAALFSLPAIYFTYGFYKWNWGSVDYFHIKPEEPFNINSDAGDADKYGHLFGTYAFTRFGYFMLKSTGLSKNESLFYGAVYAEAMMLFSEIGDGFTKYYGFDPYDVLFNNLGILVGVLLAYFPMIDNIFAFQWEYIPTRYMRERIEKLRVPPVITDYSGQKYFITIKPAGIPHVSLTPLRYINLDFGFFSRGYYPSKYYDSETRNYFFGISANFSILSGELLPAGYLSSTMQTIFNYYHLPWDIEAKKWEISRIE